MKLSEAQYELIEAYLSNELSGADRASFEIDIQADNELRTEVERQRNLRLGLRALGIERALERAKMQYQATASTPELLPEHQTIVRPLTTWRYWAAAASIVVVLGAGYYAYQQTTDRPADIAYAETFTPDATDQLMKDFPTGQVSPEIRTQFLDALTQYKAGNYDQVIENLRTLPADKQTIQYKNYFLGLSYLANRQPTQAIPLLREAQASSSIKLRQKAEWFLALAYVKNDQKDKARLLLNQISSNRANPFSKLAQQVLRKIE